MGKYSLSVKGSRELVKLLGSGALPMDEQERIIRYGLEKMASVARSRAPGTLGGAISTEIIRTGGDFLNLTKTASIRGRVKVADRVGRSRTGTRKGPGSRASQGDRGGFRYPWALDASKRIRYRDRRTGRLTRNWFRGAKRGMPKELRARYEQAIRAHLGRR